jgi:hypothetical protein
MSSAKIPRKRVKPPPAGSPMARDWLHALVIGYYAYVGLVVVFDVGAAGIFGFIIVRFWYLGLFVRLPGLLVALTLAHLLWGVRVLFERLKDEKEEMEVRVPRETAPRLHQWVGSIAKERDLPAPDEIRVSSDSVAHVYQRINGKDALVLGAVAVRALPQSVLEGVVGQQLGYLSAGDKDLLGQARRCYLVMQEVERAFHTKPPESHFVRNYTRDPRLKGQMLFMWAALLNPATWAVRGYHSLFLLAYAAYNRQCTYVADQHAAKEAGAEEAARAVILQTVAAGMKWTRLISLAETTVESKQAASSLFEQQTRAVRGLQPAHWQDAIRKELKRPAGSFDMFPSLKDRLAAIGVSAKTAPELTPSTSGTATLELFDGQWPELEGKLVDRLMSRFRKAQIARAEATDKAEANRAMLKGGERPDW